MLVHFETHKSLGRETSIRIKIWIEFLRVLKTPPKTLLHKMTFGKKEHALGCVLNSSLHNLFQVIFILRDRNRMPLHILA